MKLLTQYRNVLVPAEELKRAIGALEVLVAMRMVNARNNPDEDYKDACWRENARDNHAIRTLLHCIYPTDSSTQVVGEKPGVRVGISEPA